MLTKAQVIAKDTAGNEFIKTVTVQIGIGYSEGKKILDFGWPVQYCAEFLIEHYPFQRPMCIDMGGRNHKGSPVTISAWQMDKVLEGLVPEMLPKQNKERKVVAAQ